MKPRAMTVQYGSEALYPLTSLVVHIGRAIAHPAAGLCLAAALVNPELNA